MKIRKQSIRVAFILPGFLDRYPYLLHCESSVNIYLKFIPISGKSWDLIRLFSSPFILGIIKRLNDYYQNVGLTKVCISDKSLNCMDS